jgi:TatD DNase family protein
MFVDSHCHLDFPEFAAQMPAVLERMVANRVTHALCISVDMPDFPKVLAIAEAEPNLYASVGTHPDYEDTPEPDVEGLVALASHPKVVAIGETGLDYYRRAADAADTLEWQRERFRVHIRAARAAGKPLVVHTRASADDTLRLMREERADEAGGVMHCFTESWEVAQAAIDLGFYISLSGIVTFKNAKDLHDVARRVPLDRLLIETDSPYLAPVPYRGKTNEPSFVAHVAGRIAELRDIPVEDVGRATTDNFFRLFAGAVR